MKWLMLIPFLIGTSSAPSSCSPTTSDNKEQSAQEVMLDEANAAVGMPAIRNFRERRELKQIYEMRDQAITTYTYIENLNPTVVHGATSLGGKFTFLGVTIGYPMPYSTQYTNPQKLSWPGYHESSVIAQADPNSLFSPTSAEGTWVLMLDPVSKQAMPEYVEPRVGCFTFKLPVDP